MLFWSAGFWSAAWRHLADASWLMAWPAPLDDGSIGAPAGRRHGELPPCCLVPTTGGMVVVCLETPCGEASTRAPDLVSLGLVRPRRPIDAVGSTG